MSVPYRLAIAEGYAARGWAVFPCRIGSKQPATRSGFEAGTTDMVTVRQRWRTTDYNIGIWTGESKLVVIDLDIDPAKGPPGISTFLEICAEAEFDIESTYCVATPKGGLHVYFIVDDGNWYPPSVSRVAPNIDVRSSGSYVVAAGSVVDGFEYDHCCANQPIELPRWLGIIIDRPPPDTVRFHRGHDADVRASEGGRGIAFQGIAGHLRDKSTAGVDRNSYFYWAVRAVGDHIWPADFKEACVLELQDIGHEIGLTDAEIRDSTASARRRWP